MSLRQAYLKTGEAHTTNPDAAHSATLICWLVLFPLGSRAGVGVSQTLTRSSQSQPPLQSEPNVMSETFLEQVPKGHWGQTPNTYLSSTNCSLAVFASQQKGPGFDWQVGVCWDGSLQETVWYNLMTGFSSQSIPYISLFGAAYQNTSTQINFSTSGAMVPTLVLSLSLFASFANAPTALWLRVLLF